MSSLWSIVLSLMFSLRDNCLAPLKRGHVERIYLLIYSVCARRTYCVRDVIKVLNTLIDIIGHVIWH